MGISYEADQRHVEIMLRDLGLESNCKSTPIPYVKPTVEELEAPGLDLSLGQPPCIDLLRLVGII